MNNRVFDFYKEELLRVFAMGIFLLINGQSMSAFGLLEAICFGRSILLLLETVLSCIIYNT